MTYSAMVDYSKRAVSLEKDGLGPVLQGSDAFICAAGFEKRASRLPLLSKIERNPIVVTFENGPAENQRVFARFRKHFERVRGFDVCVLDLAHADRFERAFEKSLLGLRDLSGGYIVMDISGLPNFAICIAIAKIRTVFPGFRLTLLYTEAEEYFPQRSDFNAIKAKVSRASLGPPFLSGRAASLFIPSMFAGVSPGDCGTCLVVFAGYEPHRTSCVLDACNPSKLVMAYGEPERSDLKWRTELSRIMHSTLDRTVTSTEERISTSEIGDNLALLLTYYDHLYDDHLLAVCPNNSKMQAVASVLAWETYPDIQLCFAIPVEYLPARFSKEYRDTFAIDLGSPGAGSLVL